MKKLMIVLACLDVLVLALLLMGYPQRWFLPETAEESSSNILYYSTANKNPSQENNGISSSPLLSSSQTVYIIREYDGQIGVFAENQEKPFLLVEVLVDTLPQADQKMLQSGITVRGDENLNSILEDYES